MRFSTAEIWIPQFSSAEIWIPVFGAAEILTPGDTDLNWILANGYWNDSGKWIDISNWND